MLRNPDTALTLYVVLVVVGLMLGRRWAPIRNAIASAGSAGTEKAVVSSG